jgi:hypothetical protein
MSSKKILAIGFVVVLLVAIPLTVFLVQQQQKTKSGAVAATVFTLTPTPKTVTPGDLVTLAVNVIPGVNQVGHFKFKITYDTSKLATAGAGLVVTPWTATNGTTVNPTVEQGPIYDTTNGTISMTISIETSNQLVIPPGTTPTQVASVTFDTSNLTASTTVSIDKTNSWAMGLGSTDQYNENVLLDTIPATINTTVVPTVTVTPTVTVVPTVTTAPQATATGPTCSSLTVDPSAQGTAPYTVNLTATGQDSTSTISKLTFDFGDGQTQDVASSAGLGTNSISVLQSHTYNNPGSYTATAVLTDADGSVSPIDNCSVGISVSSTVIAAAPTTVITEGPSSLPPTGPSQLITIGSIGAVITVIGAILLFAL